MIEVDDARVSSILSTKRKRMVVIDLDKLYVLNKSSSERVIFFNNKSFLIMKIGLCNMFAGNLQ
jgi:hypothetical protein